MHQPLPQPPTDNLDQASPPTHTAVLHASAFPHILDRVLAHLAPDHLYPLRAVSRTLQRRIDNQITCFRVLLVDHRWRCLRRCVPPVGAVPIRNDGEGRECCVKDLPPDTLPKVVQLRKQSNTVADALDHMGTVHTVQRCNVDAAMGNFPAQIHPSVSTIVDSFDPSYLGTPAAFRKVAGSPAEERYHQPAIPISIRRYILHAQLRQMPSQSGDSHPAYDVRFVFPPNLREFVLVLWPYFQDSERLPFNTVPLRLMSLIGAAVTGAESYAKTTIVGADRLSPMLFGHNEEQFSDPADAVEAVRELMRLHQMNKLQVVKQRFEEAQDLLKEIEDEEPVVVGLNKRVMAREINHRDQSIKDLRGRVGNYWRRLGRPDLRFQPDSQSDDDELGDINDIYKNLPRLRSLQRKNAATTEQHLAQATEASTPDKLLPVRFLTLEEWWRELGPTRRRYEGFALDRGTGGGGDEAVSLSLVKW